MYALQEGWESTSLILYLMMSRNLGQSTLQL